MRIIFPSTSEALPLRWMSATFPLREVSSGLISTTAAPDSFAIRGMSQAGETCAEVPITTRTPQVPGLLLGLLLGDPRDRLAEQDHVGLEDLAAVAQGNGARRPPVPGRVPLPAVYADQLVEVPVVLDHPAGARRLVQSVHVLGDDGAHDPHLLESGHSFMRRVGHWLRRKRRPFPKASPTPCGESA